MNLSHIAPSIYCRQPVGPRSASAERRWFAAAPIVWAFIFARKRAAARDSTMAQSRVEGSHALRNVLSFTLKHWGARKALVAGIALAMLFSTLTEVVVPVFAGHLVEAAGTRFPQLSERRSRHSVPWRRSDCSWFCCGPGVGRHGSLDVEYDVQHLRRNNVSPRSALFHRLAQQQLWPAR